MEDTLLTVSGEWKLGTDKGDLYMVTVKCNWPHRDSLYTVPYENKEKAQDDLAKLFRGFRYQGPS